MKKLAYGALFTVALPALLVLWSAVAEPNVTLPVYGNTWAGVAAVAGGLAAMLTGMWQLWTHGGGLPMNAYPPPRLVTGGLFSLVPHPIYAGFVAVCFGVSMLAHSAAGLWLVSPCALLGCAALVLGYERPALERRFGRALHILPADDETRPSELERWRFFLVVVLPWIALYQFTIKMGLHGTAFQFAFEDRLPIYPWTSIFYQSTYLTVAVAPWCARTRRDLRQLMISGWVAMAVVFPVYWIMPSSAPRRPLTDDSLLAHILMGERNTYPPSAAFPSFHVLWAVFVSRLYRPAWLGVAYTASVVVTCITTGMHYIPDVLTSLLLAPLFLHPERVWSAWLRGAERIANSWCEWRVGPVRVVNHAVYAGLAGFVAALAASAACGPGREWKGLAVALAGVAGAAAWAHWIEGSAALKRPFGFYGGLIAAGLACLLFEERWTLLAACCLAAPWMQAIGRLRCLVNGCCHGAPAAAGNGIRVEHPRSRVTRLAGLAGVPIHATQLYSILGNVAVGLVLLRLWLSGCPLGILCGAYALGNGLARFVEEGYRGEPQTPTVLGLHLYQWTAVASVAVGAIGTAQAWPGTLAFHFTPAAFVYALLFAVVAAVAMGVDFPESNGPLARLT